MRLMVKRNYSCKPETEHLKIRKDNAVISYVGSEKTQTNNGTGFFHWCEEKESSVHKAKVTQLKQEKWDPAPVLGRD